MTVRVATILTVPFLCLTLAACGSDDGEFDTDEGIVLEGETGADSEGAEAGDEGSDTEGESDTGEGACETAGFTLETVTPNVMLVLDKSGSMNDNSWDDDGDSDTPEVTRWHSLHNVVAEVTGNYEDAMHFGVTLFPAIDAQYQSGNFESSCKVSEVPEVGVAAGSGASILAAIPAAEDTDFGGATPATEGILTGASHLEGLDDAAPDALVLITDGAANCASADDFVGDYDEGLEDAVRDAWDGAGIPTFVVGIDIGEDGGSVDVNPREALNKVAHAGGVANQGEVAFYDATDPAALEEALDEITQRLGCQIELGFTPEPYLGISIEVDGEFVPQLDSCEGTDEAGWVQIDPVNNPTHIELCNAACTGAEAAGGNATMCPVIP